MSAFEKLTGDGICGALVSSFVFEEKGALQTMIHHLKYSGHRSLGTTLGRALGERFLHEHPVESLAGVIPVPLHPVKQRERGYNQAAVIAEGFTAITGLRVNTDLLLRSRFGRSQTTLSRQERMENVRDAFTVDPGWRSRIGGMTFVLVDDVVTTGATIRECAGALVSLGANPVVVCSVALAG
jgi:ComF family protein